MHLPSPANPAFFALLRKLLRELPRGLSPLKAWSRFCMEALAIRGWVWEWVAGECRVSDSEWDRAWGLNGLSKRLS